ncbi:hypothetical protein [Pseudomonas turukhanskensis]|uniref:Uncharacterized protein n=1 Tax=Pseudomonas turukhanskensis TaxID=1806536 RepID=A0A9W6K8J1_9PSED|nr:hypothetical protein [Pseudomonas turukhanskensis]GLK90044.1 hypothetical protein GCM10017655_31060 [Pseudomonas turukhanskensis]
MSTYQGHRVEDHQDFIFNQLLPSIVGYARDSGTPSEVVAFASFLSLATILHSKGVPRATIIAAMDAARVPTHLAPEVVQ